MSRPILGTLAETYLRGRAITHLTDLPTLRFHPRCFYRPEDDAPVETWPALIAAVTDLSGTVTGVHRTWLDASRAGKAPIATPRRAMGHLLGNAVRFGTALDVLAAGEGIETMLSLREALPGLAMAAALSANHLAAMLLPASLRVLYVVRDAGTCIVVQLRHQPDCLCGTGSKGRALLSVLAMMALVLLACGRCRRVLLCCGRC